MDEKLIIRLDADPTAKVEWMTLDNRGQLTHGPERSSLADLSQFSQTHTIVVLIPALDVLLTEVTMPKMSTLRMRKAVPFVLEEELIEDVAELHFALGKPNPAQMVTVAVIKRNKLQNWLSLLQAANVPPAVLLPETLAIPYQADSWSVFLENDVALVRSGLTQGFATDAGNLVKALQLSTAGMAKSPTLQIASSTNLAAELLVELKNQTGLGIITNATPTNFLSGSTNVAIAELNLLQGDFQPKQVLTESKQKWRKVGYLAAIALALWLVNPLLQYSVVKLQQWFVNHKIMRIYQQLFPNADVSGIDIHQRIIREMQRLQDQQTGGAFLDLLARVGAIVKKFPNAEIKSLIYDKGRALTITVQAQGFDNLAAMQKAWRSSDLNVQQLNANSQGQVVQGEFLIKDSKRP